MPVMRFVRFVLGCLAACAAHGQGEEIAQASRQKNDPAEVNARPVRSRDRDDPSLLRGVVVVDTAGEHLCTGALIGPRLVLTARRCVSETESLPARASTDPHVVLRDAPSELAIFVASSVVESELVAYGLAVATPSGAVEPDDLAVVLLDEAVLAATPVEVRSRGTSVDEVVNAVGFEQPSARDPTGAKVTHDGLRVSSFSTTALTLEPPPLFGIRGAALLDAKTSELLGLLPRASGEAGAEHVAIVAGWMWLVEAARAELARNH